MTDTKASTGRRKAIALTYDDGPAEGTDQLLSVLAEEAASATFFLVGEKVTRFPEVMTRLAQADRVEIGSHTLSHPDLTTVDREAIVAEITGNAALIHEATGSPVHLFRPPWGRHDGEVDAVARSAKQSLILYSLDSGDWSHHSVEETVQRIVRSAVDGDIVLLHDTLPSTVEASRPLIRALKSRGFALVTVSELLGDTGAGHSYDGLVARRIRVLRWGRRHVRIFRIRAQRVLTALRGRLRKG